MSDSDKTDYNLKIHELENKVRKLTDELKDSYLEIEDFSHYISHDLRAPLRHIMEFIDLLRIEMQGKIDDKTEKYLDIIKGSSQKLNQYIDSLLSYSRTGREKLNLISIDLNELIRTIIDSFADKIADRRITWKIKNMPFVNADPVLLKQVFLNLIDNCIKFTKLKETAVIEIGFRQDNANDYIFYFTDNGAGFSMKNADRLFNIFQKLNSDKFEGMGMGLAIVKKIIKKHGGKVWAIAEDNKGSTFYFSLPCRP
jgi:two-component system sensor histidine kinase/response regulator